MSTARDISLTDALYSRNKIQRELEELKLITDESRKLHNFVQYILGIHLNCEERLNNLKAEMDRTSKNSQIEKEILEAKLSAATSRNTELTETVVSLSQQVVSSESLSEIDTLKHKMEELLQQSITCKAESAADRSALEDFKKMSKSRLNDLDNQLQSALQSLRVSEQSRASAEARVDLLSMEVAALQSAQTVEREGTDEDLAKLQLALQQEKDQNNWLTQQLNQRSNQNEYSKDTIIDENKTPLTIKQDGQGGISVSALLWKERYEALQEQHSSLEAIVCQVGRLKAEIAIAGARQTALEEEWRTVAEELVGDESMGSNPSEFAALLKAKLDNLERKCKPSLEDSIVDSTLQLAPDGSDTVEAAVGSKVMRLTANPHRELAIKTYYENMIEKLEKENKQMKNSMMTILGETSQSGQVGDNEERDSDIQEKEAGQEEKNPIIQAANNAAKRIQELEQKLAKGEKFLDRLKTAHQQSTRETSEVLSRLLGWRVTRMDGEQHWRFIPCHIMPNSGAPVCNPSVYFDISGRTCLPQLTDQMAMDNESELAELPVWDFDVSATSELMAGIQKDREQMDLLSGADCMPLFLSRFTYLRHADPTVWGETPPKFLKLRMEE